MRNSIQEYESKIMQIRNELDGLDREIVMCLLKRFDLTEQVGVLKYDFDMPIFDHSREAMLLERISDRVAQLSEGKSNIDIKRLQDIVLDIYGLILTQSKMLQKEKHVEIGG